MDNTCIDIALFGLSVLQQRLPEDSDEMMEKIQLCESGLRFLKMFFWSILTLEDTDDAEIKHILMLVNLAREDLLGISTHKPLVFSPFENTKYEIEKWILDLLDRIQTCKKKFEEQCGLVLRYSLRCDPLNNSSTLDFFAAILQNLKDLYKFKTGDEILLLNNQIATLERKVTLLHNFFNLTPVQWWDFEEIRSFNVVVHVFAQYSANLVFLYWVRDVDEDMATQLNVLLFNVLLKYRPCVPIFKAIYIRFLEEIKLRRLDSLPLRQLIQIILDLLLENVADILKDDYLFFKESLTFLISFLAEPPDDHEHDEEWMTITAEIDVLVKEDFSEANTNLSDLMRNVENVKGKILLTFDRIWDSFSYDFPKINGLGFFDFLLQNLSFLKEKLKRDTDFIPFAKHLIIQIEEELMSLRPYLNDLFEGQKDDEELKDTWFNIIDLAYRTEYAINSCSVAGGPLWYNIARLMEVLDEIKEVYRKVKKAEGRNTHDCSAAAPNRVPAEGPSASSFNEVMVSLEDEANTIVEHLIYGSKSLDIVAIVGMLGLGKTTMAKKVYNAPAVRNHFRECAYCIVSQDYSTRKILLDILGDMRVMDDNMYEMAEEDLAQMLHKFLLDKRYLIIMDDIWDIQFWDEIKGSLPNNQKGSRVIFTTRVHNLALLAKKDCIIHCLRFMSEAECWELFRRKAFQAETFPPYFFLEVGKRITKCCKGLPLYIVLIAGLLRTNRSLRWWNKIAYYLSTEGCTEVLELCYQHLPEHLKPCFLYFGAFVEDKLIRVNKLALLWIAEGFVLNSKQDNLENVARDYLNDLVDRSLVIVNETSSYGGIKSCRIHDLVHAFCQMKAREKNFFQLKVHDVASTTTLGNPYRLSIHGKGTYLGNICPNIRTLLVSCKWGFDGHGCYDLSNLKLVQVMDLEELDDDAYFLREMHRVVNLRFMSISCPPRWVFPCEVSKITLHDFVSNCWNLEFLILNRTAFGELPEAFWNMTRLRHVDVQQCSLSVNKREACPQPQMINLVSFSSLHVSSTEDIQVLLQRSPSLQKLGLYCTDEKLSIHFPAVESLSKLESLNVTKAGVAFVRSFHRLSSLKKLSLTYCHLDWRYLSVISKIPCLEVLKLLGHSFVGPKWDMDDTEFPKLKYLKLQDLDLDEWIATVESFPSGLEVLFVDRCNKLKTIPTCFEEMHTLKRIEVRGSSKSVAASVVDILEAQKELGNQELQLIIQ